MLCWRVCVCVCVCAGGRRGDHRACGRIRCRLSGWFDARTQHCLYTAAVVVVVGAACLAASSALRAVSVCVCRVQTRRPLGGFTLTNHTARIVRPRPIHISDLDMLRPTDADETAYGGTCNTVYVCMYV